MDLDEAHAAESGAMETHGNRDAGAGESGLRRDGAAARLDKGDGNTGFFLWCAIPVAIVVLLRIFVFGMYVIPSRSMENTIMPGDRVITTKLSPRPVALKRGDIVVFKDPSNWLASEETTYHSDYLIKTTDRHARRHGGVRGGGPAGENQRRGD